MSLIAPRTFPFVEVDFHTSDALYSIQSNQWDGYQPTKDLLSVETHKDLASPVGTFQLLLTGARANDGTSWYERLDTNDIVVIKMGRPPARMATVMVGLIDEVRRTKAVGMDGTPEQRVRVRGSDMGKILTRAMLRFYPSLVVDEGDRDTFIETSAGWQAMLSLFTGADLIAGKPADMIRQAMIRMFFRLVNVNLTVWEEGRGSINAHMVNLLRFRLADTPYIQPFVLTMLDYEGSFWNFIERVSIKPFNELFIDVRGITPEGDVEYMSMVPNAAAESVYSADTVAYMGEKGIQGDPTYSVTFGEDKAKVVLFLRNTPFDYARWNGLYTHDIEYSAIISEDLGFSDQENYNLFLATNSLSVPSATNLKLLAKPVLEQENAGRYGLSPLEIQIEGIQIDDDKLSVGIAASQSLSEQLRRWYRHNKDYKSGTIAIRGNGYYKVGQRVRIRGCEFNRYTKQWDDLIFYIEGVQQSFNVLEGWTTGLTLTRGQRLDTTKPD